MEEQKKIKLPQEIVKYIFLRQICSKITQKLKMSKKNADKNPN